MGTDKRQYYKTWVSYKIPMQPTGPITYAETEKLNSFYLAYYNGQQLVRFIKYLVKKKELGIIKLSQSRTTHLKIFFESLTDLNNLTESSLGEEISYIATENKQTYYVGYVDNTGFSMQLQQVEHQIFFCDDYAYWPDGTLKERVMTKQDGSILRTQYDERGKIIQNIK